MPEEPSKSLAESRDTKHRWRKLGLRVLLWYPVIGLAIGIVGLVLAAWSDGENPLDLLKQSSIWIGLLEYAIAWPVFVVLMLWSIARGLVLR